MQNTLTLLTATLVQDEQRVGFWPRHFGTVPQWPTLEHHILRRMECLCPCYSGGQWHYYLLSNGGIFITPDAPADTLWPLFNKLYGSDALMSSEAAGITASLMTYCHHAYRTESDAIIEHYHRLRAFATQHPEAHAILSLID